MRRKETMLTNKPNNWRTGQTLFNFLEWVATEKGYPTNQSSRMADPFYIQDIDALYEEYIQNLQRKN